MAIDVGFGNLKDEMEARRAATRRDEEEARNRNRNLADILCELESRTSLESLEAGKIPDDYTAAQKDAIVTADIHLQTFQFNARHNRRAHA